MTRPGFGRHRRRSTPTHERTGVISLDVETTGLDPERHEVWEVGLVEVENEAEHWWEFPIQRLREADPGALAINGYYRRNSVAPGTDQACALTGLWPCVDAAFDIARLTTGETLLGCNVAWDAQMLSGLLRFYGAAPAWSHRHLELGSYAAAVLGLPRPLSTRAMEIETGLRPDEPHTALPDARWNVTVFKKLQAIRKEDA